MWQRLRTWLNDTPLTDPIQRSQAHLFQAVILVLFVAEFFSLPLIISARIPDQARLMFYGAAILGVFCYLAALVLIRRGRFAGGVYTGLGGLVVLATVNGIPSGVLHSPIVPLVYMLSIILAGGIVGWRGLAVILVSSLLAMTVIGMLESLPTPLSGYSTTQQAEPVSILITVTLLMVIGSTFLGLFGGTLRRLMQEGIARQHELEQLRDSLEQTVATRTASLEAALRAGERREATLSATLAELQDTRATVRDLSAPVIPVLPGVLVIPLVGAMDAQRIADVAERLLHEVDRQHAAYAVFDITGMPVVDTQVAQTLLRTAESVRLLGGKAILVGVRPEVAQTLVALGTDLVGLTTYPDLREAVATLIDQSGARTRTQGIGRVLQADAGIRR